METSGALPGALVPVQVARHPASQWMSSGAVDCAAVSTPGVAWGHGRLFLAVHWAGSHGGEGGSRALQVVCGSLSVL